MSIRFVSVLASSAAVWSLAAAPAAAGVQVFATPQSLATDQMAQEAMAAQFEFALATTRPHLDRSSKARWNRSNALRRACSAAS